MSTVKSVSVQSRAPSVNAPSTTTRSSGSSNGKFAFVGVTTDGSKNCIVVLKAGINLSGGSVNGNSDGVDMAEGPGGEYCVITLGQTDTNNWTVGACTDKDKAGASETFVAGSGGGGGYR